MPAAELYTAAALDWIPVTLARVPRPWPRETALLWLRYAATCIHLGHGFWRPDLPSLDRSGRLPDRRQLARLLGDGWVADGRVPVPGGTGGARQLLRSGEWVDPYLAAAETAPEGLWSVPGTRAAPPVDPRSTPHAISAGVDLDQDQEPHETPPPPPQGGHGDEEQRQVPDWIPRHRLGQALSDQAIEQAVLEVIQDITGEEPDPARCSAQARQVLDAWRGWGGSRLPAGELRRRLGAIAAYARMVAEAHDEGRLEGGKVPALWYALRGDAARSVGAITEARSRDARLQVAERDLARAGWAWTGTAWAPKRGPVEPEQEDQGAQAELLEYRGALGAWLVERMSATVPLAKLVAVVEPTLASARLTMDLDTDRALLLAMAQARVAA